MKEMRSAKETRYLDDKNVSATYVHFQIENTLHCPVACRAHTIGREGHEFPYTVDVQLSCEIGEKGGRSLESANQHQRLLDALVRFADFDPQLLHTSTDLFLCEYHLGNFRGVNKFRETHR
jgi:hypothetical protein